MTRETKPEKSKELEVPQRGPLPCFIATVMGPCWKRVEPCKTKEVLGSDEQSQSEVTLSFKQHKTYLISIKNAGQKKLHS